MNSQTLEEVARLEQVLCLSGESTLEYLDVFYLIFWTLTYTCFSCAGTEVRSASYRFENFG